MTAGGTLRPSEKREALVGKHAAGHLGNRRPSPEVAIRQDCVGGCPGAGLACRYAVEHVPDARPTDHVPAQHAWFHGRIERAVTQVECSEPLAGLAYGFHFGVCARVARSAGPFDPFPDDLVA